MDIDTQTYIKLYYVYSHTRLDTNQIFYIGMGTSLYPESPTIKQKYSRAFAKHNRSRWWTNIISKTQYQIDILFESNSREVIREKEIELIAFYKREDINNGILVNMTNGGDGANNRVYTMTQETKDKLSDIKSIPIYCYNSDGTFKCVFRGIKYAASELNIYQNNISSALKGTNYSKGYYFFRDYKGYNLGYSYNPSKPHTNSREVYCYLDNILIYTYPSLAHTARALSIERSSVYQALKKGFKCRGYNLSYIPLNL